MDTHPSAASVLASPGASFAGIQRRSMLTTMLNSFSVTTSFPRERKNAAVQTSESDMSVASMRMFKYVALKYNARADFDF